MSPSRYLIRTSPVRNFFRSIDSHPFGCDRSFAPFALPSTRILNNFWNDFDNAGWFPRNRPIEVEVKGDKFLFKAELPGAKKENLSLTLDQDINTLTLAGKIIRSHPGVFDNVVPVQKSQTAPEQVESVAEISSSSKVSDEAIAETKTPSSLIDSESSESFHYVYEFPTVVDPETIKAKYEDGILFVEVSKKSVPKTTKTIEIN